MSMGWLPLFIIEDEERRRRQDEEDEEDRRREGRRRQDLAAYERYRNHFERRDYPGGLTPGEKEDLWVMASLAGMALLLTGFVVGLWLLTEWLL